MDTAARTHPTDETGVADSAAEWLFAGPGEMRARCRALDWSATRLGAVGTWSPALRAAARLCLDCARPMCVFGGPELVHVYNDAYAAAVASSRHPQALGRPAREVWADLWDQIGPEYEQVMAGGPAVERTADAAYVVERGRGCEETYWTWATSPIRDDDGRVVGCHTLVTETSTRVRVEAALRASEERQAFLLELSDALRSASDAVTVQELAARTLGEHLGLSRVFYAPIERGAHGDDFIVTREYHAPGATSIVGRYPVEGVGARILDELRAGRTAVAANLSTQTLLSEAERVIYASFDAHAYVAVPLVKDGRLAALMTAHQNAPRDWTPTEVALIEATAERTWAAVERARADSALRVSEEQYRTLFERMDEGFALCELVRDADGRAVDYRYIDLNPALVRHGGITPDALRGRRATEVFPDLDPWLIESYARVVATGESILDEHYFPHVDRWLRINAFPRGGDRFAVLFGDVTVRRRAEEALRASEARFRAMADVVPDLLWESEPDGSTPWYNARWLEYTGQTLEEAQGWGWTDSIHPDDRARSAANYARATERGETLVQEHRIRRHDGEYRWFLVRAEPRRDEAGRIVRWFGAATDVHAHRMALEEAERLAAERTAERDHLRRQLAAAEEAERRRLARELHDHLGQQLTGLSLGLEDARRLVVAADGAPSDGASPLVRRLEQLQGLAGQMTMGARYVALELRPPELDDMGFENALETYVREWSARFGVAAEVVVTGETRRALPPDVGSALYRIAQEAMTNAAKHAQAT